MVNSMSKDIKACSAFEPYLILDPALPPESGSGSAAEYVPYDGVVDHLFFHPLVTYPEVAFSGDMADGFDDWMLTVGEYQKILQSIYAHNYVLVDISDCWSEKVDGNGRHFMVKNTLYLPAGKKPLVFSFDDVNYYRHMLKNGFTYKLVLDGDHRICSWGLDPSGREVVSRDLDAIPILDKFVEEHPDFSPFGAKGCLSVTGYQGILGYRTMTDVKGASPETKRKRQEEIEAVKPVIAELKRTGWTFGCHTWKHIDLSRSNVKEAEDDMRLWMEDVGTLVGKTDVLLYPYGHRSDKDDLDSTGPIFRFLHSCGFRIFCAVGEYPYSKIKDDICAVVCDRPHADGVTLRGSVKSLCRYARFFDARKVLDLEVRPKRRIGWMHLNVPQDGDSNPEVV